MQAEIVMIGTELLLGQIEDTNATWMGQTLADNGINLYQKTTVGDNKERIIAAMNSALDRSDVVLCSGGLGPTEDDITRECVAEVTGCPLEFHADLWEQIEAMFTQYRIPITENNKKQAMVPKDSYIVQNPQGSAPGVLVECDRGIIACMPGVPRELKAMLLDKILPFLKDKFDLRHLIHYRVLKVCGMGESRIDEIIGDLMTDYDNPKVGVLASPGSVRIRISARANSIDEANRLIDPLDAEVRKRLPGLVMGTDDDTIESVVNDLLVDRGWTLSVVETISGGNLSRRLSESGASQFAGGRVYTLESLDLGNPEEAALAISTQFMVECTSTCSLGMVSDPVAGSTCVVFVHPDGHEAWQLGRTSGRNQDTQDRVATVALEQVRRFLAE